MNKNETLPSKGKHRRLILAFAFIMVGGGIVSIWMLVHYFGDKPEVIALSPDRMNFVTEAVVNPQAMTGEEHRGAVQIIANISANLKAATIKTATRKSIDVLRDNFRGLTTIEQKKAKVREIMEDLDRNYVFNDTTQKLFNKEFIGPSMDVYMKEVSAEERSLYDPIIHEFIRKMNVNKK
jgi:hypothetical protein